MPDRLLAACQIGCDLKNQQASQRVFDHRWDSGQVTRSCRELPEKFAVSGGAGEQLIKVCEGENPASLGFPVSLFPETTVTIRSFDSVTNEQLQNIANRMQHNEQVAEIRTNDQSACGGPNQRPCHLWERFPSCRDGLIENFDASSCVWPETSTLEQAVNGFADDYARYISAATRLLGLLSKNADFFSNGEYFHYLQQGDIQTIIKTLASDSSQTFVEEARKIIQSAGSLRFESFSIGLTRVAALGIGGAVEDGLVFGMNTNQGNRYMAYSLSAGLSSGVQYGLVVGFHLSQPTAICGESKGISFSVDIPTSPLSAGISAGFGPLAQAQILADYNNFQSISAGIALGVDLPVIDTVVPANLDFSTSLTLVPGSTECACGGLGQRPCSLIEKFPSCNDGLVEDFLQHLCVAP